MLPFIQEHLHLAILSIIVGGGSMLSFILPPNLGEVCLGKIASQMFTIFPFLPYVILILVVENYGVESIRGFPAMYTLPIWVSDVILSNSANSSSTGKTHIDIGTNYTVNASDGQRYNIVIFIEESLRGDFLFINGSTKAHVPSILNNSERLFNYGTCTSGSNNSVLSNEIIRRGMRKDRMEADYNVGPFLWEFARIAGYKSILIDAQKAYPKLNNNMTNFEASLIDSIIWVRGSNSSQKDKKVVKILNELLDEDLVPKVIYVIKSGVHFPYANNYDIQSPGTGTGTDLSSSYSVAIEKVIEPFFYDLFKSREFTQTMIIYTSDHGQNLKLGQSKRHNNAIEEVSLWEGIVPFIVVTDNPDLKDRLEASIKINMNNLSHFNIFPTVLQMMGFQPDDISIRYGHSIFEKVMGNQGFFIGYIIKSFGGRTPKSLTYMPLN
jgi:glucan phosphoethanolaminetransferase (alkaline phosphatase superfamily)